MHTILNNHSILYVEDEPEIQANVTRYLGNYFNDIYLASDGQEAIAQYHKHQPDVLLLDINLPYLDGLSVAQEVRKNDQKIKIIMLTAFTEKEKLLKATELKLTKYLIKPVAPKDFQQTLDRLADELMNNPSSVIKLGDNISWNIEKEQLNDNGELVILTEKQLRLIKLFIDNKGQPVMHESIITTLWDDALNREISIDSVKSQVSQLRKKAPSLQIISIYGGGYILK